MRILLTNDDGVQARGLAVLKEIALELSDDVWIVAPAQEQSAASRGVSLHNPVVARKIEDKTYSVSGTPTDCMIVAMSDILKDNPPDLVLSGINHGQNIAEDIGFSGTVAGALQGLQMGVPSIALSQARGLSTYGRGKMNWSSGLAHGAKLIRTLLDAGWDKDVALNINFPDVDAGDVKGIHATIQGKRDFIMSDVDKRKHPRGGHYYWLTYGAGKSNPPKGTDLRAVYDGYISVTPIHVDHTHYKTATALGALFED
ncbi:MAG: 5'/3'-nucleotidase SurE [Robiginitomaculum sp.]|nr:MAG: 5'/3'-nucleotidase SurE [Robiginitomaculum sp.]